MKKMIFQLCLLLALAVSSMAQYDDGYVTNGLPVNVNSEKFETYIKGLKEGLQKVTDGVIRSDEDIVATYGIDLLQYPRLSDVVASQNWAAYNYRFTPAFLRNLNDIFSKVGGEFDNVRSIRDAFRHMPELMAFNAEEAEALAAIDITVQEIAKRYLPSLTGESGTDKNLALRFAGIHTYSAKLPSWVRCVFGVIGEAIAGGFSGIRVGALLGGAVGGVIGGIIGVGGGVMGGIAKFCN